MNWKLSILSIWAFIVAFTMNGQESLVGHWSFDVGTGDTIYDESGYGNHGIIYGAKRINGKINQALSFDGVDDFAEITGNDDTPPEVLSKLGTGTISIWFKVDTIPTDYGIAPLFYYGMEKNCDFFDAANKGLIIELGHSPIFWGSKALFFTIWKNGCTYPSFCFDTGFPVSEGEWHHFAVTVAENHNTGFLDGEELTSRRYNFGTSSYSQFFEDALAHEKLWLGKGHWDTTTQFYNGAIDDIRIYDYPMTENEIKNLYSGVPIVTSNRQQIKNNNNLKVFPNPVSEILYYDLTEKGKEVQGVQVVNTSGKIIMNQLIISSHGKLNISHLPEGIYHIRFIGEGNNEYKKRIVVRR